MYELLFFFFLKPQECTLRETIAVKVNIYGILLVNACVVILQEV